MIPASSRIAERRTDWQKTLSEIQAQPLARCHDFPAIAERWNAWWRFKSDRPLLVVQVNRKRPDIRWDKGFDLLDRPDDWLRVRLAQLDAIHVTGDALPLVRVDIGPVAMAAFVGAPLHFAQAEQTSWQDPIIHSWQNVPPLDVDPDNKPLCQVLAMLDRLAEAARGKFLVCLPDLTGAPDALANLRSTQALCLDLYENREPVLQAANDLVDAWENVFCRMYDTVLAHGAGITQWVACWSETPFTVPTCDFNALIGPDAFNEICLPSLAEQGRRAGLCVFHLDGPDASRHAETLARAPEITAIQYTPGAATPSAVAMLPMLKGVQRHNVPLFIDCPVDEVETLVNELDPRGLALRPYGLDSPQTADALVEWRDAL